MTLFLLGLLMGVAFGALGSSAVARAREPARSCSCCAAREGEASLAGAWPVAMVGGAMVGVSGASAGAPACRRR